MTGIDCPAAFAAGDGRQAGVGTTVYALAADEATVVSGTVMAVVYECPFDPAAGWVVLGTTPYTQHRPRDVYATAGACREAARGHYRRAMLAAGKDRERFQNLFQALTAGASSSAGRPAGPEPSPPG